MCHFDTSPFTNHSIYNKKFYNLQETGKNYYYRILNRSTIHISYMKILACREIPSLCIDGSCRVFQ